DHAVRCGERLAAIAGAEHGADRPVALEKLDAIEIGVGIAFGVNLEQRLLIAVEDFPRLGGAPIAGGAEKHPIDSGGLGLVVAAERCDLAGPGEGFLGVAVIMLAEIGLA